MLDCAADTTTCFTDSPSDNSTEFLEQLQTAITDMD